MSEGTRAVVPADRAEVTQLREQLQVLTDRVDRQHNQLVIAAQNFATIVGVLKQLGSQGTSNGGALEKMVETVRNQQLQIEGLALIQRVGASAAKAAKAEKAVVPYDPAAHSAAAVSPFALRASGQPLFVRNEGTTPVTYQGQVIPPGGSLDVSLP